MSRDYFDFIPIFNIHEVGENVNPWTITTEKLESFLKWISKKGYQIISIDDLYKYYLNKEYPQDKIVLTFDDGRKGIIKNAIEILKYYDACTTIYLVYDWLHQVVKDERERYSDFLDINDIEKLMDYKITIGYHTKSHRDLRCLDDAEIITETITSKQWLEKELGINISHFSYPYGKISAEVSKLLMIKGNYKTIVTSDRTKGHELYHLPRISLKEYHTENDFEKFFEISSWHNIR